MILNNLVDGEIFRCIKCFTYINNKFERDKNIFKCNICKTDNEILNKPGFKNEYMYKDLSVCPELYSPTIDFKLKNEIQLEKFIIIIIDVSKNSIDLNYPQYVNYNNLSR